MPASQDIIIAGGGLVGLTLAVAVRKAAPSLSVTVFDGAPPGRREDGRASAIAAAARRMLQQLGLWNGVAADAQPITEMTVTDSRTDDVVRPVFLTFDGALEDGEPFAHMVPNGLLLDALGEAARAAGATVVAPAAVTDYAVDGHAVTVTRGDGGTAKARLLVAADGVRSRLRALSGIRTVTHDYPQVGIVVTVAHERPHHGRAEEHFLPGGAFAILPLAGNRSSLVWTEKTAIGEALVAADDATFAAELEKRFGHRLGAIRVEGRRSLFPIGVTLVRDFVRPRFALAGDAAHGIHPLAGQGLNLGFRDVAALAETVVDAARLGLDIGAVDVLERYQRWRRFDTLEMTVLTDALNRLFSNDNPVLRLVRDVGLGLVDRVPALKRMMIGEAAGDSAAAPRLLRGEAI
ncbi:MAG: ubiquinone biosynthesis hydroxylase [Bauldia sp.]|nr:ubiquinone biosynthesis hydroxylase [Bauldia sp.]